MNNSNEKHSTEALEESSKHPELARTFTFWYSYIPVQTKLRREDYENEIKKLGSFSTIEGFWMYYQHMVRPEKLPLGSKFCLFQEGIRPAWEDKENQGGGSFVLRIKKEYTNKFWEDLLLSFIGEQFEYNDLICGLFLNVKPNEMNLAIWTKFLDDETKYQLEDWVRKSLGLNDNIKLEYRYHPKIPHPEETHQKPQPKKFERNEEFRKKQEPETRS